MRALIRIFVGSLLLCLTGTASAAWHEARSKHFIIYADMSPKQLQDFATRLERFDQGVRAAISADDPPIGNGNRLTLFVFPTAKLVQQLAGDKAGFLSGLYSGRAAGPLAYVAKKSDGGDIEAIFYHEYTHHLMMQQFDRPYPQWYVEGFAEFFSTPRFEKDGSMWFGAPVQGRAWGLLKGKQLPLEAMLGGTYGDLMKLSREDRESIYGRGWLLAHYLLMENKRKGQLNAYINAMAAGKSATDAATAAFGDIKALERELDSYRNKSLLQFKIGSAKIQIGAIELKPMSQGAAQVVIARGQLKYGAKRETAEQLLPQIKAVASSFPGDELVESTLAEAELLAGNSLAAEAAADRALKANAGNSEAMVLKGRAIVERALDAGEPQRTQLFELGRKTIIAANKIDPEDPEPLYEFYRTYIYEGKRPTANAIAAMHYASELVPQDFGLRMNSALAYLQDNKLAEARSALTAVAYSPHGGGAGEAARRMVERIDAGDGKGALAASRRGS